MSISLCMIVKNEEQNISKCLESVKDFVAEMIVIDTGSNDRTKALAEELGAKVYDFKWNDSFSDARNESLKYATSNWILVLDADEQVINWDENLEKVLEKTTKDAFELKIEHEKEEKGHHHYGVRLFRNKSGIQYKNRIHEQLIKDGKMLKKERVGTTDIHLNHTGYQKDVITQKNKDERNLFLLEKELKENPNNLEIHFHLANQHLSLGDELKAMYHYKIATDFKKNKEMMKHCILKMIFALYKLKRYDELFQTIKEGKEMFSNYTDIYFAHGEILEEIGHDEGAILQYQHCLKLGETKGYYSKQGVGTILPLKKLKRIYNRHLNQEKEIDIQTMIFTNNRNDYKEAIRFFELQEREIGNKAVKEMIELVYGNQKEFSETKRRLLEWHGSEIKYNDANEINSRIKELVRDSLLEGIQFLMTKNQLELANLTVMEHSHTFENKLVTAEFYYQRGLYRETIAIANELLKMNNEHFRAIDLMLLSAYELGEKELVRSLAKDMLKLIPFDDFYNKYI